MTIEEELDFARGMVTKLRDGLEAHATGGGSVQSYSIGTRSVTYRTHEEMVKGYEFWRAQVAKLEAALAVSQGLPNPRRVFVRFGA